MSGYVTTTALNTALANYTTTSDLTTLLSDKQDTISDLSTIRSGAALGATALQSHQDISGKVDKVSGKGLSTNDYTTDEKNKLSGIESGAQKHIAPSESEVKAALGTTSGTSKYLREDGE